MGAPDEVKKRAAKALRDAGRAHLPDIGVVQLGRGPRLWGADCGWWVINVAFQASSYKVGSFLNVGIQHLWDVRHEGRYFRYGRRVSLARDRYLQFLDLDGDEETTVMAANTIALAAREACQGYLALFSSDQTHFEWLANPSNKPRALDRGAALSRLGEHEKAGQVLLTGAENIDLTWDSSGFWRAHQLDLWQLSELTRSPAEFDAAIDQRIRAKRADLGLPPLATNA